MIQNSCKKSIKVEEIHIALNHFTQDSFFSPVSHHCLVISCLIQSHIFALLVDMQTRLSASLWFLKPCFPDWVGFTSAPVLPIGWLKALIGWLAWYMAKTCAAVPCLFYSFSPTFPLASKNFHRQFWKSWTIEDVFLFAWLAEHTVKH